MAESREILFREKEQDFIKCFLGPSGSCPYPCLFVYGHSSTGKTLVVSSVLSELQVSHIWVNCHEVYSPQLLFSSITKQASVLSITNQLSAEKPCNNVCDLINTLKTLLSDCECATAVVFDNAEVLISKRFMFLSSLVRLQELTGTNIVTIFIADVGWEKFRATTGLFEPLIYHFGDYTKEQLIEILCLDCPPGYPRDFYKGYVDIIMKVFFIVTRNLNELRHVAVLNFSKYCEPIESGEATVHNVHKLFKNIEPTLKKAIHAVYLREVSGPKWDSMLKKSHDDNVTDCSATKDSKFYMMKELPFYSKFLLIAAYLASYNQPKTDYKHFVKNQGKQAKKKITKKPEKNRHLLGPKPFPLDRMLSIFTSIVGHMVPPSSLVLSQVSSLVSLHLMCRVSAEEQLDSPKYKCLADLELVVNVGKTVSFDVVSYLDDFQ